MKGLISIFGFVRASVVEDKLQFARTIGKRLDEHREVVEQIECATALFRECPWHTGHMAVQDDYLMQLYHMVHGSWPDDFAEGGRQKSGEYVRPRPVVLEQCQLPEYPFTYGKRADGPTTIDKMRFENSK